LPAKTRVKESEMKRYLLNVIQPTGPAPPPEQLEPIMADVQAVTREMQADGVWLFAAGLHDPERSTVVRVDDGDALITDGPFAEGKEHVGGFTAIEVDDLDAALAWARKVARATTLPIEVRPIAHLEGR
jgi:hypothetical protein